MTFLLGVPCVSCHVSGREGISCFRGGPQFFLLVSRYNQKGAPEGGLWLSPHVSLCHEGWVPSLRLRWLTDTRCLSQMPWQGGPRENPEIGRGFAVRPVHVRPSHKERSNPLFHSRLKYVYRLLRVRKAQHRKMGTWMVWKLAEWLVS